MIVYWQYLFRKGWLPVSKTKFLLPVMIILSILLTACGKSEQVATTEPTVTATSYTLTHVESGVISYQADEFEAAGTLELNSDGTACLHYGDQDTELIYDDSNMWTSDNETELHPYSISGLVLTLEYFSETLTFVQN